MKIAQIFSLIAGLALVPMAMSATATDSSAEAKIKQKLQDTLGVNISLFQDSPIEGLYQVLTDRGVIYVTKDANPSFL